MLRAAIAYGNTRRFPPLLCASLTASRPIRGGFFFFGARISIPLRLIRYLDVKPCCHFLQIVNDSISII